MRSPSTPTRIRLAIVVSHPIQYYAPLYRLLAAREDLEIRVFFTWHAGLAPVHDRGFGQPVAWDIPLTDGYAYEPVPNVSSDPGTHHFFGLQNPSLIERVLTWRPDAVHVTGWAWESHLRALRAFAKKSVPTLFRGDSHLLDSPRSGPRWWVKRAVLERVYHWPSAFLVVGSANRDYYTAFGVEPARLFDCPHSIDVARFADVSGEFDREASEWRRALALDGDRPVLLFAGKFEKKKRPVELMRAVQALGESGPVLVLAGGGELEGEVKAISAADPDRFRVLPFQNQSRMPVVYRLGDLFVLPSAYGETWGLAVSEAMACGRAVLVSDRVGCAADVVHASCGRVFSWDLSATIRDMSGLLSDRAALAAMGQAAALRAWEFDIARTEAALLDCLNRLFVK